MKLKELLHGLDVLELHADEALDITGVQYDSRQVTPGALFVAISGFQTDGHKYIPKAMENGAVCVVCEKSRKQTFRMYWFPMPARRLPRSAQTGSAIRRTLCASSESPDERQNDQHVSAEARA